MARAALEAKDYAVAENYTRQSLAVVPWGKTEPEEILAEVLKDEGKNREALQVYKVLVVAQKDYKDYIVVSYAMLLLKSGQWTNAVGWANSMLYQIDPGDTGTEKDHFSPSVFQPTQMAVDLHIAQGVIDQHSQGWGYHVRLEEGMREFAAARHLAPQSDLANYYYGYGWGNLDLKSRTRAADAAQARAALQKASLSKDDSIRKAAEEALGRMR